MITYIVGAGAMGCRFGYQMAEAGQKVVLFDGWQDHIQAIKEKGLIITGDQDKTVALDIRPFGQDAPVCDLMILFVKAHQPCRKRLTYVISTPRFSVYLMV